MRKLQCLIADDEPIARQILEKYISDLPNLELVATCKNAFEVLEILPQTHIDILFLDINMPKLSGISLLKSLQTKPAVIITTAYPEYAIQGFELAVTDYLLKPFSMERFFQAVLKAQKSSAVSSVVQANTDIKVPEEKSLFVKSDKKIIKIHPSEISHIEAYGNYIKIFANEMILSAQTLTNFTAQLNDDFIRVHKSFVINFKFLKLIDGNQVVLNTKVTLPIGKAYRSAILDRIS